LGLIVTNWPENAGAPCNFPPVMTPRSVTASAPGRLDVLGGIADYSGALVLQLPIREITTVTLVPRADGGLHLSSDQVPGRPVLLDMRTLLRDGRIETSFVREQLRRLPGGDWAGYVAGCFLAVHLTKAVPLDGATVTIRSAVPPGKGVSSSAALEVATLRALTQAYGLAWSGTELARLAQWVENQVVGAPCGLMDQLASAFGQLGHLLPIRCQPDRVGVPLPLPDGLRFVGIDSGVRHAVGGASYGEVRTAAFMGYSLLAHRAGTPPEVLTQARHTGERSRLPFGGYLANVPHAAFHQNEVRALPEQLAGAAFLRTFGETIDDVTTVDPDRMYAVRQATRHPIDEQARVERFLALLDQLPDAPDRPALLRAMGTLFYEAHASYSACGLGHARTDELVAAARTAGRGVYGAKITGGGSGGTVCLLCDGDAGLATAHALYEQFAKRYGETYFFE
jgi:galactokinase